MIHRLKFGASWVKIVEAPGGATPPPATFADPGLRYLTFETPDLDEVWQRAADRSIEVVAPLVEHAATGARAGSSAIPTATSSSCFAGVDRAWRAFALTLADVPLPSMAGTAAAVEAAGFSGLFLGDHVLTPRTTSSTYPYSGNAPTFSTAAPPA